MKKYIKNNVKLLTLLSIIIVLGIISTTLALTLRFGPTSIDIDTANVIVNVRYEKDGENNDITSVTSNGDLVPITLDTSNINNVINSNSALKYKFWVSGDSSNPNNSIYDIALNNITMDCELKNTYVKWVLYKNNTLLSSGSFSPTFDTMPNNKMLLTSTQENLTTTEDEYLFAMYIEDTCSNINNCPNPVDQSSLLGRSFSASIGIETSTKTKKTNTRTTGNALECSGEDTSVVKPVCKEDIMYMGSSQTLLNAAVPTGVTVNQSTGTDAGEYTITATLSSGYKWSDDDSTEDYVFTCKINKRSITISTQDQAEGSFTSSPSKVNVINLISVHSINSIHLSTINTENGEIITPSHAVIYDSENKDVTNNYTINYQSTGKIIE